VKLKRLVLNAVYFLLCDLVNNTLLLLSTL